MQNLAIIFVEFQKTMIIQDDNRCIKLKLFLMMIKPAVLMCIYNPVAEFFFKSFKCLFTINLISVMQTRQFIKMIQV